MLVLLLGNLIILPVAICFFNDDLSTRWVVFNGVSDVMFLLDLLINFRTGIIVDNFADEIILEPRKIAERYMKTWFLLDFISSLPMDYIIVVFSPESTITQLAHAASLATLFPVSNYCLLFENFQ
ncbi:hypothetical protein HELRODRAFT_160455 [Helobdella robusta]|uniref:Ion transport domain-containing protein n=1 Tax=Helobdella robusta TaxID=6412 RepID=T1EQ96_HELRO|nr:hypothetical protein HELRODRAFT_160455 [Helobdella robusta]ESO06292.1 hypothetical protein HELRODRAFT_160455 [Helobdella robusta]